MDAAVAGIIGAGIGAIASLGVQALTGWTSRSQARDANRAGRAKEIYESRRSAYAAFLNEVSTYRYSCWVLVYGDRPEEADEAERLSKERYAGLVSAWPSVVAAYGLVRIEGPKGVATAAVALREYAAELDLLAANWFEGCRGAPAEFKATYQDGGFDGLVEKYCSEVERVLDALR